MPSSTSGTQFFASTRGGTGGGGGLPYCAFVQVITHLTSQVLYTFVRLSKHGLARGDHLRYFATCALADRR